MGVKLYQNGKVLCEVDNVDMNFVAQQSGMGGGMGKASEVMKSPDSISFTVPIPLDVSKGDFYLKDNRGNVINIVIDSVNDSTVRASVRKYYLQIILCSTVHQAATKHPFSEQLLAQRIKEAMKNAGLSRQDLAKAMGVTESVVSRWRSKGHIKAIDLYRIAKLTNTAISFFFWEGPEKAQH
jgi:DNA-binding Xre family transcriptional regulator